MAQPCDNAKHNEQHQQIAEKDLLCLVVGERQLRYPSAEPGVKASGDEITQEVGAEDVSKAATTGKEISFNQHIRNNGDENGCNAKCENDGGSDHTLCAAQPTRHLPRGEEQPLNGEIEV